TEGMDEKVILKVQKTVKEQVDSCTESRQDLKEEYQARYNINQEYGRKLLTEDELQAVLEEKFSDLLSTKNKGQIMKAVMGELKGKADGKVINQVDARLCQ